jgi:hypothetical protein
MRLKPEGFVRVMRTFVIGFAFGTGEVERFASDAFSDDPEFAKGFVWPQAGFHPRDPNSERMDVVSDARMT